MIKIDKSNHLLMSLKPLFKQLSQYSLQGAKRPSHETVEQREMIIVQEMKVLLKYGYKLKKIKNIKQKHFDCLLNDWYKREYTLKTLKMRISLFTIVFKFINKAGMQVISLRNNPIPKCFYNIKKSAPRSIFKENCLEKLEQLINEYPDFAIYAELMRAFGLSKKESLGINPVLSYRNNYLIISIGASRGKERSIFIESDYQKEIIQRAIKVVDGKSTTIRPRAITEQQCTNKFNYICKKIGVLPSDFTVIYYIDKTHGIKIQSGY